jgi:hypothetical protein
MIVNLNQKQAVQLPLQFQEESKQEKKWYDGRKIIWETDRMALVEPNKRAGKDPCKKCWAKGLCDSDTCGRKLFPIDVDELINNNEY